MSLLKESFCASNATIVSLANPFFVIALSIFGKLCELKEPASKSETVCKVFILNGE